VIPLVQVTIPFPTTLADLEATCAVARQQGMDDDAAVGWNLFAGRLVITRTAAELDAGDSRP
jgi:hypothetical protein